MDIYEHKRGLSGFTLAVLLALLFVCAISCQGNNTATPTTIPPTVNTEQSTIADEQQPGTMPAPLDALRGSAEGSFHFVNTGSDFEEGLAHRRVIGLGEIASFTPHLDDETSLYGSAYAIYRFDFTHHLGDHSFTTTWNPGFDNWDNLYLGLSDWNNNSWHWQQTEQGLLTDPAAITPYINDAHQLLMVVALNRGQRGELEWLFPGTFPDEPVVLLNASTVYGDPALVVEFDASQSFFPEGTPSFEWDENGDGINEHEGITNFWTTTYYEPGEYTATVRVTYPGDVVGTSSVDIVVRENTLELSEYGPDKDWGLVLGNGRVDNPYELYLEATLNEYSFEVTNAETGAAVPFEGLTWHYSPPGKQPFEFVAPGVIRSARLGKTQFYVTDDEGRQSNLLDLAVIAFEGEPTNASFSIEDTSGLYPFRVEFDYSNSIGGDYSNAWCEWDYDGDGVFDYAHMLYYDLYHARPSHIYHEAGEYEIELKITDYAGISDTTSTLISVVGNGPRWHFDEADEFATHGVNEVVEANGKPGLFLNKRGGSGKQEYYFATAQDSVGTQWNDPVLVDPTPDDEWTVAKAGMVGGVPAMFIYGYNSHDSGTGLRYFEALDAEGTSWGEPQTLSPYPNSVPEEFLDNNGSPCLVVASRLINDDTYRFIGYDGVSGENGWFEADVATGHFDSQDVSSAMVDGKPAMAYREFNPITWKTDLMFVRALDAEGKTWGTPIILVSGNDLGNHSLNVIDGTPRIIYFHEIDREGAIYYLAALDSTGTAWRNPVAIFPAKFDWGMETRLLEWNNTPYVFIRDWDDTFCSLAQNSGGFSWGPKQPYGGSISMVTIVNDMPYGMSSLGGGMDDWYEIHERLPTRRFFGAYY